MDYDATPFDPEKHIQKIRNISVYQGNAIKKDTNQSTDENARCLMCLVENNESMLLPGDCLYQEFPREFQVQYLAVPHHCCDYPNDIRNLTLSALKELVIFARPHRRYRHPNRTQLDRLLAVSQPQVIYLMKFDHFYFDGKREINTPPITITGEYHRISL